MFDLDKKNELSIAENDNGPEEYLGHAKANNDYIVWHAGIRDFIKMHEKGILYIYN